MRDPTSWLGSAIFKPANADPPITPPAEIRNQAKLGRAIDGGFSVQVRKDVFEAYRAKREAKAAEALDGIYTDLEADARREVLLRARLRGDDTETIREAWPGYWGRDPDGERRWAADSKYVTREIARVATPAKAGPGEAPTPPAKRAREMKMAKHEVRTESDKDKQREALRAYLAEHGPTPRKTLIEALGYPEGERGYYQLRTDCDAIGAGSESRQGPVSLPDQPSTPAPKTRKRPAPPPASDDTEHEDVASLDDAVAELTDATLALARAQERHRKAIEAVKAWAKS